MQEKTKWWWWWLGIRVGLGVESSGTALAVYNPKHLEGLDFIPDIVPPNAKMGFPEGSRWLTSYTKGA